MALGRATPQAGSSEQKKGAKMFPKWLQEDESTTEACKSG